MNVDFQSFFELYSQDTQEKSINSILRNYKEQIIHSKNVFLTKLEKEISTFLKE